MENNKPLNILISIIVFLVISLSILGFLYNSKNKELRTLRLADNTQQTINKIEENKEQIARREQDNKVLTQKINNLNSRLIDINRKLDNKYLEERKNEIKTYSINDINNFFIQRGYSTNIKK